MSNFSAFRGARAASAGSASSVGPAAGAARIPSVRSAPPMLFCDRGCPFAHRVLALLDHLGCPVDLRESLVGHKPAGIGRYSASGSIPLLVHGDLVLTESRVMLEHLAEHLAFADAYPADLGARTLHRHAMAMVDNVLAPLLHRTPADADKPRLGEALTALEVATATVAPRPCLLAFHVAPIWLRFRWWHPGGPVIRAVEAHAALCVWLDAAAQLDCITRTAPDLVEHCEDFARARQAGLLSPLDPDGRPDGKL